MVKAQGNNKSVSVKATAVTASPNVDAKPITKNASVEATNSLAKHYSDISEDWAIGEGLVQGVDYSSKMYAAQSKSAADAAIEALEETKTYADVAVTRVQNAEGIAISNINMLGSSVSDSIEEGITRIGETTEQALNDLEIASNEVKNEILAEIQEQANIVDGYAEQAEQSAIRAQASATTAKEQADIAVSTITTITEKANIATSKASEANISAANAKASETNAKNSATSASTSASNAQASASNASVSATTATNQATIATQQANIAKQEVAKLANVYNFKGSVATYANLPTNANVGDVYDVQENGANYAWTGSEWDSLGGVFKTTTEWGELQGTLSNQTDLKSALDGKQDALIAGGNITIEGNVISAIVPEVDAYTKSETDALLGDKQDVFSTETPLELKTTINSTQNKLEYVDGVVTVQNTFQCVTQNNLGYSTPTQNKAYGIPRYITSCTVGTNGGSGKNITVSKNGDLNYISYPFTFQPNKEIIFPINYMLGYFDNEDVFNLVIKIDNAPYSNTSYYYVPLIANNATGHRWDTSTTTAFSMLCLCSFGGKKPLSKQEAELIAYSLSCTSLTVGATLTLKLYYNYRTASEAVTLKTITLTENMVSALSKVSVAIATPYSYTSVYPSNTYVQAPITDSNGNVLFNTGGEDIITRGLLLNHDNTLRVVNGALSANLDDYALKSDIPNVSNFITMSDVEAKKYLTSVPSEYVTDTELTNKGYLVASDISGKADTTTVNNQLTLKADKSDTYTKAEVDDKIADAVTGGEIDLSGYAKTTDVDNKLSLKADKTEIPNISNLATKDEVNAKQDKGDYALKSELPNTSSFITMADVEAKKYLTSVPSEYVTDTELNAKGYLTQHQDISNLATKTEVQAKQDKLTAGENITIKDGVISAEGGGMPIGTIYSLPCTNAYVPDGSLPCDGAEYAKIQFEDLWNNYLVPNLLNTCTYAEYEQELETYGQCEKFAIDETNGFFRVPKIENKVLTDIANTVNVIGNGLGLGLGVDNTGLVGYLFENATSGGTIAAAISTGFTPPLASNSSITYNTNNSFANNRVLGLNTNANLSGVIADTTNAKTYTTLRHFVVIANGTINDSQMNWSEWASSLQGKADVGLSNITASGTSLISSYAMPSNKYVDLTLGASGTTYTAPANGWFWVSKTTGGTNQWLTLKNATANMTFATTIATSGSTAAGYIPVQRNQIVSVSYSVSGATNAFRFIYAQGEV